MSQIKIPIDSLDRRIKVNVKEINRLQSQNAYYRKLLRREEMKK